MRISDWSSDVCSSDLADVDAGLVDALVVEARVGAGEVHELEQAELRVDPLAGERPPGAGTGGVDHQARKRVVEGKSVSVSVGLGGRCHHKKKNIQTIM